MGCTASLRQQARDLPILDVAGALGIEVVAKGGAHWTRCLRRSDPESDDRVPSVRLYPRTRSWTCFRCDAKWYDNIQLVIFSRRCSFVGALQWMKSTFRLNGALGESCDDPGEQWAWLRGVSAPSVRAFGCETSEARYLRFPMRLRPTWPITGWQKRRADNDFVFDGARSVCEKGGHWGLFLPQEWPDPAPEDVLVICEGEADAVAVHSIGFTYAVGTPGATWNTDVSEALEALVQPFKERVLVMDGNVDDATLLANAHSLGAEPIRVPVSVSSVPGARDVNEWLRRQGADAVRAGLLGKRKYTVLYDDAIPDVLRTVEETCGLQSRHRRPLSMLWRHLLQSIHPLRTRYFDDGAVAPGQWVSEYPRLARVVGTSARTIRTCLEKSKAAGLLDWEPLGGTKGVRITVLTPSAYVKLTRKSYEDHVAKSLMQAPPADELTTPLLSRPVDHPQAKATGRQAELTRRGEGP